MNASGLKACDRVRFVEAFDYALPDGAEATVVQVGTYNTAVVETDDGRRILTLDHRIEKVEDAPEDEAVYAEGDRVRLKTKYGDRDAGEEGVVKVARAFDLAGRWTVAVEFDRGCQTRHPYEDQIERIEAAAPVESAPKIPDAIIYWSAADALLTQSGVEHYTTHDVIELANRLEGGGVTADYLRSLAVNN